MAIAINWIDQQKQITDCVDIALFEEKLIIHYFDDVIAKMEWSLVQANKEILIDAQWKETKDYLTNPANTLTVNLMKQGSAFRNRVWAEMCKIPVGQTLTYSALARKIDSGARAVANACRENPFPVIIPCHRVVSVSGLGGYMGQTSGRELRLKRNLLALEATLV